MRAIAKNGGVILVEGRSVISRIIRAVTGQNISHAALLFWIGDNLFMAEMREFKSFVLSRASDRLQQDMKGCQVYYGEPPEIVAECTTLIEPIFAARNRNYGYLSLGKVLLSQFKKNDTEAKELVCSTYVATVWRHAGVHFKTQPDPGDYLRLSKTISPLDLTEYYEKQTTETP